MPAKPEKPFNIIFEGEWNDIPCADYPLTPERWAAETIRPLANTHVDTLFYNLCSSDGYVCELQNGELLLGNVDKFDHAWMWRYRENTRRLIEAGANPPDLAVEHGRRLGLNILPVVRMNDEHDQYDFARQEVSAFKLANPHLLIGWPEYVDFDKSVGGHPDQMSMDCFTWGMFDYAHEEVREHKFAIIEEFITRWDNDGISLDFDRSPRFFKEYGREEDAALMTDFIRRVRTLLDETAQKRNRPQHLHVRLIPEIEVCKERGMDIATWVKDGLVDAISPGCGYLTFSLDLAPWLDLVDGHACWVYPSNNKWKTPDITRAWAKLMYQRGAHGLYLFNWGHVLWGFEPDHKPNEPSFVSTDIEHLHPCFYEVLSQVGELSAFETKDSTYSLESYTHRPMPGEDGISRRKYRAIDRVELPIVLDLGRHQFTLPFAENIEKVKADGLSPSITLRLTIQNTTAPDEFDISVNGRLLDQSARSIRPVYILGNDSWVDYTLTGDELFRGENKVEIEVRHLNPQIASSPTLKNVDLFVKY